MSLKLVIADDEAFIRQAYQDGLTRAGFEVVVAEDGVSALAIIKQQLPQLILLDLIMPKMNGFEVLKALKADEQTKHIPVIILSNLSQPTDEAEVKKLGATDFLIKSDYSMKQLIEKIKSLAGNSSA